MTIANANTTSTIVTADANATVYGENRDLATTIKRARETVRMASREARRASQPKEVRKALWEAWRQIEHALWLLRQE